jgi:hypothetical protein
MEAVTVGTIIGAMIGVISLLLRFLVVAKNKHIEALEDRIQAVQAERDLFRDLLITTRRSAGPGE